MENDKNTAVTLFPEYFKGRVSILKRPLFCERVEVTAESAKYKAYLSSGTRYMAYDNALWLDLYYDAQGCYYYGNLSGCLAKNDDGSFCCFVKLADMEPMGSLHRLKEALKEQVDNEALEGWERWSKAQERLKRYNKEEETA